MMAPGRTAFSGQRDLPFMAIPTKDDFEAAPEALLRGAYCLKIEDFFAPAARDLIGRFLSNFTESVVIAPAELVFSAKYQKRLSDAGRDPTRPWRANRPFRGVSAGRAGLGRSFDPDWLLPHASQSRQSVT